RRGEVPAPLRAGISADELERAIVVAELGEDHRARAEIAVAFVERPRRVALAGRLLQRAAIAQRIGDREVRLGAVGAPRHQSLRVAVRLRRLPLLSAPDDEARRGLHTVRGA